MSSLFLWGAVVTLIVAYALATQSVLAIVAAILGVVGIVLLVLEQRK